MYKLFKEKFDNIPNWFINFLSVVSGLISVLTPIGGFIWYQIEPFSIDGKMAILYIVLICFTVILLIRVYKYGKLSSNRLSIVSHSYHMLLHMSRDTYFEIMKYHKKSDLSICGLTETYKRHIVQVLDILCDIMESYTKQKICASIKFITVQDNANQDYNNAKLITFGRSTNSDTNRDSYEKNGVIVLKENTDFFDIVDPYNDAPKNYFYQSNLEEYSKILEKNNKQYKNSNPNWRHYYIGTIVVPIRLMNSKLYTSDNEDSFDIIGFLCVDSLSKNAFTLKQEKENVETLKSFADLLYILLGQYRHYLNSLNSFNNK